MLCHSLIVGYIGSQVIVSFDEIARETLLFSLDKALGCHGDFAIPEGVTVRSWPGVPAGAVVVMVSV